MGIWLSVCTFATHTFEAIALHVDNLNASLTLPKRLRANISLYMTVEEKSGIQQTGDDIQKQNKSVIFSSMNRECPTHYAVHTFLLWADLHDDQNSYNQYDRQNRSYNKCDSNSIILPSNAILSTQYKSLSPMERRHLEVVRDGEVQRFSFSEFFSLQSSIQLAEFRNAGQTHPHDKVLVFYTPSVIIRLGYVVCPVHRDLLICLITRYNNMTKDT